jgi:hypothetical protein
VQRHQQYLKVVENLQLFLLANSAGSSSVTQPVSTAFINIPSFAKVPEEVCQHIQSRFGHISVRMTVF